ncbi:hypothetical protein TNIN_275361 [Trichonephila inaurata madagascariensis]|uniref:Uncharacterized protein n=1 Tax=Trichonephila inaurata madagascariensis TaxID=2747483 RepID=A0A8X7BY44_9ARAC|nr:hypothetical protein TNIN_275361 [Trichonephila inaurata madagascariensis]
MNTRLFESVFVCKGKEKGPAVSAPVALPEDRVRDAKLLVWKGTQGRGPDSMTKSEVPVAYTVPEVNPELTEVTPRL